MKNSFQRFAAFIKSDRRGRTVLVLCVILVLLLTAIVIRKRNARFVAEQSTEAQTVAESTDATAETSVQATQESITETLPEPSQVPDLYPVDELIGGGGELIGLSLPDEAVPMWAQAGDFMVDKLETAGYKAEARYAAGDLSTQIQDIQILTAEGCKLILVSPVQASGLTDVLNDAKAHGIKIVAYERLPMQTDAVTAYIGYDEYRIGELLSQYVIDALKLDDAGEKQTAAIFAGDPDDEQMFYLYPGLMDTLFPYIDGGKLEILGGQELEQTTTLGESTDDAQNRMKTILDSMPSGSSIGAVICTSDKLASGVSEAISATANAAGSEVVTGPEAAGNSTIVTGVGDLSESADRIRKGTQTMTLYRDPEKLGYEAVKMIDALVNDEKPEINNSSDYDTGRGKVEAFLIDPVIVTKDNLDEAMAVN